MDPEIIIYNKKLTELKKYLPFLEDMENRLKSASGDKNGVQLSKIQGLKNLIKGDKRMKMINLIKCEQVLMKLYKKTTERIAASECSAPVKDTIHVARETITVAQDTISVAKGLSDVQGTIVKEIIPDVKTISDKIETILVEDTSDSDTSYKAEEVVKPKLSLNFYKEQSEVDIEEKTDSKDINIKNQSESSVSTTINSSVSKTVKEIAVKKPGQDISIDTPSPVSPIDSPRLVVPVETPYLVTPTLPPYSPVVSKNRISEGSKIKINLSLNKNVEVENSDKTEIKNNSIQSTINKNVTVSNSANAEVKNNARGTAKQCAVSKSIPSGKQITTILSTRTSKQHANNSTPKVSCATSSDVDMRTPFSDVDMRFSNVFMNKQVSNPNVILCNDKDTSLVQCDSSLKLDVTKTNDLLSKFNNIPVILNRCNNKEIGTSVGNIPVASETFSSVNIVPGFASDSDFRMIKTSYTDPTDIQNLTDFNIPSLNEVRTDSAFSTILPISKPLDIENEFEAMENVRSKLKSVVLKDKTDLISSFNSVVEAVTKKSKDITSQTFPTKSMLEHFEKKILGTEDKRKSPITTPRKYTRVLVSPVRCLENSAHDHRLVGSRRRYSRSPSPWRRRSRSRGRTSKYTSDAYKRTQKSPRSSRKYDDSFKEKYKKKSSPRRKKSREKSNHRTSRSSRSKDRLSHKKVLENQSPTNKTREIELLGKKIEEIIELNELKRKREKIVQELQEESFLNPEKSPDSTPEAERNKGEREDGELGESDEEVDMLYSDLSEDQGAKNKIGKVANISVKNAHDKKEKMASSLIKLNMIIKDKSFKNIEEKTQSKFKPPNTSSNTNFVETMLLDRGSNVLEGLSFKESSKSPNEGLLKKMADIITKEILPAKEKKAELEIQEKIVEPEKQRVIAESEKQICKSVIPSSSIEDIELSADEEDKSNLNDPLQDDILKALASDTGTNIVSGMLIDKKEEHVKEMAHKTVLDTSSSCFKARRISLETYKEKHINSGKSDDDILENRKKFQDIVKSVFTAKELARFDPILQPAMDSALKHNPSSIPLRPSTPVVHNYAASSAVRPTTPSLNTSVRTSIPGLGDNLSENKNEGLHKARQLFSQAVQNAPLPPWATPVNREFDVQPKKHVYASPFSFTPNSLFSPEPEDRRHVDTGFSFPSNSTEPRGTGSISNISFNSGLPCEMSRPLKDDVPHNQRLIENKPISSMSRDFMFSPRSGFETPDRQFNSNNSWDKGSYSKERSTLPITSPRDCFMSPRETSVPRTPQHETNYGFYGKGNDSFSYRGGDKLWNESNAPKPFYDQNSRYPGQTTPMHDMQRRTDPRDSMCSNHSNRQYINNPEYQTDNYGSRTPIYEPNYHENLADKRTAMRNMPGNRTPLIDSWSNSNVWGRSSSDNRYRDYDSRSNFKRERSVGRRDTPLRDYDSWKDEGRMSVTRDVDFTRATSVGRQSCQNNSDVYSDDRFQRDQSVGRPDDFQMSSSNQVFNYNYERGQRGRSVGRALYESNDGESSERGFRNSDLSRGNRSFNTINRFDRSRSASRAVFDSKQNCRAKSLGPRSCLNKDSMFPAYKGNTTCIINKRFEDSYNNKSKPDFNRSQSLARELSVGRTFLQESRTENIYFDDDNIATKSMTKPMQKAIELIEKSKQTLSSRDPRLNRYSEKIDHNKVFTSGSHRDPRLNKFDSKSQLPDKGINKQSDSRSSKNKEYRKVDSKDRKSDSSTHRDTKKSEKHRQGASKNGDDIKHKDKSRDRDSRKPRDDIKSKDRRSGSSHDRKSKLVHSKGDSTNVKDCDKERHSKDDMSKSRVRKNSKDRDKEKHVRDDEVTRSSIRSEHCNQREKISHFKIPKLKRVDSQDSSEVNVEKCAENNNLSLSEEKTDSQNECDKECPENANESNLDEVQNDESEMAASASSASEAQQNEQVTSVVEKVDKVKKKRTKKNTSEKKQKTIANSKVTKIVGSYSMSELDDESSDVESLFKFRTSAKSNKSCSLIFDDSSDDNDFGDDVLNSSTKSDKKPKSMAELNDMLFDKLIGAEQTVDNKTNCTESDLTSGRETRNRRKSISSMVSTESNEEYVLKPQTVTRKSSRVNIKRNSINEDLRQSEISDVGESDSSLLEIVKVTQKKINKSKLTKSDEGDSNLQKEVCSEAKVVPIDSNKKILVETDISNASGLESENEIIVDSNEHLDIDKKNNTDKLNEPVSEKSVTESPLKNRLRRSVRQTTKPLEVSKVSTKKSIPKTKKRLSGQTYVESESNLENTRNDSKQCDSKTDLGADFKLDVDSTTSSNLDVLNNQNRNLTSHDNAESGITESPTAADTSENKISPKKTEEPVDSCQSNIVDSSNANDATKANNIETKDPDTINKKKENQTDISSLVEILKNKNKMLQILAMLNDTGEEISDKVKKRLEKLTEIESDDEDDVTNDGKKMITGGTSSNIDDKVESNNENNKPMMNVAEPTDKGDIRSDEVTIQENNNEVKEAVQVATASVASHELVNANVAVEPVNENIMLSTDEVINEQKKVKTTVSDGANDIADSKKQSDGDLAAEDTTNKQCEQKANEKCDSIGEVAKQSESSSIVSDDTQGSYVDDISPSKHTDQPANESNPNVNCKTSEDGTAKEDTETTQSKGGKKKSVKGKGIRELKLLHEYNFDMFISDDVLKATGVRSCTIAHLDSNTGTSTAGKSITTSPVAKESKTIKPTEPKLTKTKSALLKVSNDSKIKKAKKGTGIVKKKKIVTNVDSKLLPRVVMFKTNLDPVSHMKDIYEYSDDNSVVEDYQLIKQKPCPKSKKLTLNTNLSDSSLRLNQRQDLSLVKAAAKKLKSSKKVKKKRNSWQSGIIKKTKKRGMKIRKDVDYCDKSYNFKENVKEFKCKMCYYTGSNIVKHYKMRHPHSEVMISRLNPEQAKLACEEATCEKKNKSQHIKMYRCRFCMKLFRVKNLRIIFDHIVLYHTGEYKKDCSICSSKDVKKCVSVCNKSSTLPPADDFIDSVTGYMCGLCNYTQLSHENLKTHIWLRHFDEECELKEIDLTVHNARRKMLKSGLEIAKTEDTKLRTKKKSRIAVENILTKRLRADVKKTTNKIIKGKVVPKRKEITLHITKKPAEPVAVEKKSVDDGKTQEKGIANKVSDTHSNAELMETDNSVFSASPRPVVTVSTSQQPAVTVSTSQQAAVSADNSALSSPRSVVSSVNTVFSSPQCVVSTDSNVFHVTANLNVIPDINIKQEINEEQFLEEDNTNVPDVNVKLEQSPSRDISVAQISKSVIKIGSIQMKQTTGKPEYYCYINNCAFNSNYLLIFMSHIVSHDWDWDGFCDECNRRIHPIQGESIKFKYNKALEHLLSIHSNNITANDHSGSPVKVKLEVVEDVGQVQTNKCKTTASQQNDPLGNEQLLSSSGAIEIAGSPSQQSTVQTTPKINVRSMKDLMSASVSNISDIPDNSGVCQLRIESVVSLNPNIDKPLCITPEPVQSSNVLNPVTDNAEQPSPNDSTISPTKDKVFISKLNVKAGTTSTKTIMPYVPTSHELFKCLECIFVSDNMEHFVNHFTVHNNPTHRCMYCMFETPSAQRLAEHILDEHGPSRFRCLLCDYRASVPLLVSTHALAFHKVRMMTVGEVLPHASVKDGALIKGLLPKRQCVLPYVCTFKRDLGGKQCEKQFYSPDAFENHVKSHGLVNLMCYICTNKYKQLFPVKNLVMHMKTSHSFKLLVCPYCTLTFETKAEALGHLMISHSGRRPLLYLRLYTGNKGGINGDKVVLLNLDKGEYYRNTLNFTGAPKDFALARPNPCQLTKHELDLIVAAENDKGEIIRNNKTGTLSIVEKARSSLKDNSSPNKIHEVSGSSDSTPTSESVLPSSTVRAQASTRVETVTSDAASEQNSKLTENDDDVILLDSDDESTKTSLSGSVHGSVTNTNRKSQDDIFSITSDAQTDEEVPEKTTTEKIPHKVSTQLDKPFSSYSNEALNTLMKGTGISIEHLFRCGNSTCKYSADTSNDFRDHLLICQHAKEFDLLSCYHCSREFRNATRLLDHIRTHGIHRYQCNVCYLCFYSNHPAIQHMRKAHKLVNIICIPLRPFNNDSDADYFVLKSAHDKGSVVQKRKPGPKSKVQPAVPQSPPPLVPTSSPSTTKKTIFGPNEISQLPLNPILTEEIFCKVCGFSTKVRSNLLRHLQMHANEVEVPSVAPINPVPHLESNEMHFDKMTNLALSSNMNKPAEKAAPKKKEVKKGDERKYPKFVPEKQRFVCGSVGCKYISVDEMMLRFHWETLHCEESVYHCVHCGEDVVEGNHYLSTGNIAAHLRLHEDTLYGCEQCSFIHPLPRNVEKHCIEAHGKDFSVCLRKPSQTTSNETQLELDTDLKIWQCTICPTKMNNKLLILAHCKSTHKIKYQYKCSMCNFSQPSKSLFSDHFLKKHSGSTPDILCVYNKIDGREEPTSVDNSPLWWKQRKRASIFSEENSNSSQVTDTSSIDQPSPAKIPKIAPLPILPNIPPATEASTTKGSFDMTKGVLPNYTSVATEGNKFKCPFCIKFTTEVYTDMQVHLFEELNYRTWVCLTCGYKSFTSDKILEHARQNHGTGLTKFLKGNAGIERWVSGLLLTQETAIKARQLGAEKQSDISEESNLVIDEKTQETKKNKKSAVDKNSPGTKCPHCDFVSATGIQMHIKRHWKIKPLSCGYCDSGFVRKIELQTHIKNNHPGSEYSSKVNVLPSTPEIVPLLRGKRMSLPADETTTRTEEVSAPKISKPSPKTHMCLKCEHHLSEDEMDSHKITCDGGKKYPIVMKKIIVLKCSICMQLTVDIEGLKEHFNEEHPGMEINYVMHSVGKPKTKRILNKPTTTETPILSTDTYNNYMCVYCCEKYNTYISFITHHSSSHEGKLIRIVPLTLRPLNESEEVRTVLITNTECCIVGCLYKAPTITCLLSHVRSHYITYKCHFCNIGFSLYKFYKDHTRIHAGMVCKKQDEFTGDTIAQDRLIKIFNMYRSKNLFSLIENERSYIFEDEMQFVSPVNTKTKQVARKSTTYLGEFACDDSSLDSSNSNATASVDEYSYYKVISDPIDLKKITISVAFFGTRKTITVDQLKAIENLFPKVLIDDLKNKRVITRRP